MPIPKTENHNTEIDAASLKSLRHTLSTVPGFFPTWQFFAFDAVTSTMDEAAALYATTPVNRALIYARSQTQGRGRHGKSWLSASNHGVYLSFLLRSKIPASQLLGLPLAIGVAISKAAARVGVETQLKWPNDLVVQHKGERGYRKIAGILIETLPDEAPWLGICIGVGMNITTTPEIIALGGAALSDYLDSLPVTEVVIAEICREVSETLEQFLLKGFAPFHAESERRSLLTGRNVRIQSASGAPTEGRVLGIATNGMLSVATAAGIENVISGEVTVVDVSRP